MKDPIWETETFFPNGPCSTDKVMEDAKTVENDRYQFSEYITDEAKQFLTERYGYKEFLPKPAASAPGLPKAESR